MENELLHTILKEFGARPNMRIWRNNTGSAYGVSLIQRAKQAGYIPDNLPITKYGIKGMADIFGIIAPNGRHISIECKSDKGKQTPEQRIWQQMVESMGGVYILARSLKDVSEVFS